MRLSLEWHVPWEANWSPEKKMAAAEKLADYLQRGTFFEEKSRMKVESVTIVRSNPQDSPYLQMVMGS